MRILPRRTSLRIVLALIVLGAGACWFTRPAPLPPLVGTGQFMQAAAYHQYGSSDVVHIERVEKMLPRDSQVVIKVYAASANPLDWHYMHGSPYIMRLSAGLRAPSDTRVGVDVAGVVELVGKSVTQFKPGDEVFGTGGGAFGEYARASVTRIALKPASITFEQAAAVPVAATTALQALRDKGKIQRGQKVLINGASGGVGTFAVQIAKSYGADVTGVCSTKNVGMVRSLGADHVVDYTKDDFTKGSEKYDLIVDNVGNHSLSDLRKVLTPHGTYVLVGGGGPNDGKWIGPFGRVLAQIAESPFVGQRFVTLLAEIDQKDLGVLAELMESKKMTSVIDRTYPLTDVAKAIAYLEEGHAKGKVVISVVPH